MGWMWARKGSPSLASALMPQPGLGACVMPCAHPKWCKYLLYLSLSIARLLVPQEMEIYGIFTLFFLKLFLLTKISCFLVHTCYFSASLGYRHGLCCVF